MGCSDWPGSSARNSCQAGTLAESSGHMTAADGALSGRPDGSAPAGIRENALELPSVSFPAQPT